MLTSNRFREAADAFAHLMETDGSHAALRHNRALALECANDFVAAAAEYLANIRAFPEYMPSYMGLTNCCLYSREPEEACHLAKAACDVCDPRAPTDPRALILLSEVLFLLHHEREAIDAHLAAVEAIDAIDAGGGSALPSQSHVMVHADFGPKTPTFYTFLERSLISRPSLPTPDERARPAPRTDIMVVFLADVGTAADIARRLRTLPRDRVFLVTIDNLAHAILRRFEPDAAFHAVPAQPHEYPALLLHIGRWLLDAGVPVLLPVVDQNVDTVKLETAATALETRDIVLLGEHGDLAALPSAARMVDYRRVPPLLHKGLNAAQDTLLKVFPDVHHCV